MRFSTCSHPARTSLPEERTVSPEQRVECHQFPLPVVIPASGDVAGRVSRSFCGRKVLCRERVDCRFRWARAVILTEPPRDTVSLLQGTHGRGFTRRTDTNTSGSRTIIATPVRAVIPKNVLSAAKEDH